MLSIYRRHKSTCKFKADRISKKCRCPLWATNTLDGKPYRRSLKTRSWERAEQIVKNIHDGKQPEQSISISDATNAFIADCESRKLAPKSIAKYRTLAARLKDHCASRGISGLDVFTDSEALDFRNSWKGAGITLAKNLEFARVMFRFFEARGWTKNWFQRIKPPKVKSNPRLPFTDEEVQNIIAKAKDDQELCFMLTLRHTGLRIGDASLLRTSQFDGQRIHLYTTKAGVPVSIRIPETLYSLLKALPTKGGYFFLRGESTHQHSAPDAWRKRFKKICKELKITPDHPHRMRHTLAADLLSQGVSVENVAAILGNSPNVVIKHYSQFVKSRQDALDSAIERTWAAPKLQRVK